MVAKFLIFVLFCYHSEKAHGLALPINNGMGVERYFRVLSNLPPS